MYNRYLRNDEGVYTRIPMQDTPPPPPHTPPPREEQERSHQPPPDRPEQFFSRVLAKLKLQDIDTADILLLLILFFLFEEKADDELLVALGLLLIL